LDYTLRPGPALALALLLAAGGAARADVVVSQVQFAGDPTQFNNPAVTGIQGAVSLAQYNNAGGLVGVLALDPTQITSSFSSKSEGALMLAPNGQYLTYMGYAAVVGTLGVSNSYTTGPGTNLQPPVLPAYDRAVAVIALNGSVVITPVNNAFSGDNPRAAITPNGKQLYMTGNADSTTFNNATSGPGLTIGARSGTVGSNTTTQLGNYTATDRPDETAKQHVKDNNFRAIGIFNGNLYVAKGSGGNGDNGVFQVMNGTGNGLPTGTGNTIVALPGLKFPANTDTTNFPFGFFFANPTTLYLADEGPGDGTVSKQAGLGKWSLVNGVWVEDYVLQAGLNLGVPQTVPGYPVQTATVGLRNLAGVVNLDGTVTLYAITAQFSSISGGEPDPTELVSITDILGATSLPPGESFSVLADSGAGNVFRGVAIDTGFAIVPEPSTLVLFGLGGAAVGAWRWRRRRAA
jgi:hypothetical protein